MGTRESLLKHDQFHLRIAIVKSTLRQRYRTVAGISNSQLILANMQSTTL